MRHRPTEGTNRASQMSGDACTAETTDSARQAGETEAAGDNPNGVFRTADSAAAGYERRDFPEIPALTLC